MKNLILVFFLIVSLNAFSKMATIKDPVFAQSGKAKMWCPVCGMSLKKFYKTSYIAKTKDGKTKQYCSLRCLVVDMQNGNIDKNSIKVIDVVSQKPILAKDAFFVVGSKVMGTMSKVSKLAFSNKKDALEFVKKYGGKIVTFDEALKIAKKNLESDIAFINAKKQKMVYPKGKMIYHKCGHFKIDLNKFKQINNLKAYIVEHKLCNVKGKPLQALSLYLWDVKKNEKNFNVHISKNEKCPVCGMFVYKYPKWASVIFTKDGQKFSFDGVKDMMKFYFNPKKYIGKDVKVKTLLVKDYYNGKMIQAQKAFFVVGSDVFGPMGKELIPFESKKEAKEFIKDHGGKIITFNEINKGLISELNK